MGVKIDLCPLATIGQVPHLTARPGPCVVAEWSADRLRQKPYFVDAWWQLLPVRGDGARVVPISIEAENMPTIVRMGFGRVLTIDRDRLDTGRPNVTVPRQKLSAASLGGIAVNIRGADPSALVQRYGVGRV